MTAPCLQEEYLIRFIEEESSVACGFLQARGCSLPEAEDLLSDLMLDFLLKIRGEGLPLKEDQYGDLKRYAWASIRNQGLNFQRKRAKRPQVSSLEHDWEDLRSDKMWSFWSRFPDAVETAVLALSPKLRTVAVLAFLDEGGQQPTREEMSRLLGISQDAVHKNLGRARQQLRKSLKHLYEQWKELSES